jgi:hypothetical protein
MDSPEQGTWLASSRSFAERRRGQFGPLRSVAPTAMSGVAGGAPLYPEILEAIGGKLGVTHRVLDVPVAPARPERPSCRGRRWREHSRASACEGGPGTASWPAIRRGMPWSREASYNRQERLNYSPPTPGLRARQLAARRPISSARRRAAPSARGFPCSRNFRTAILVYRRSGRATLRPRLRRLRKGG